MLQVGDPAPAFNLASDGGRNIDSQGLAGRRYVLFFYPKDGTPGCTKEACNFRDDHSEFVAAGAEVIGVSADSVDSHKRFADKHSLPMTLLSDVDGAVLDVVLSWTLTDLDDATFVGLALDELEVGADPATALEEVLDLLGRAVGAELP